MEDAIRIDVTARDDPSTEYARIFIFDLGSILYDVTSPSNTYRGIFENSGDISISSGISNYFFNEPKYFPQTLLDNSSMLTSRLTQIKYTPGDGISSIGGVESSTRIKFWLKPYNLSTEESKTQFFGNFNMLIYGDEASVSAWKFFYKYRLNFEYDSTNSNRIFWRYVEGNDFFFSFNHAVCYIKMEVEV